MKTLFIKIEKILRLSFELTVALDESIENEDKAQSASDKPRNVLGKPLQYICCLTHSRILSFCYHKQVVFLYVL